MKKILNIAHKGASGNYPENSMLAFTKAIEMGCDGFEADVQLTKDQVPVIFHDEKLDNLTDAKGLLADYSYQELSKFELLKNKNDNYEVQKIPKLDQLLALVKKHNLFLNLELKNNIIFYKNLEKIVLAKLKEFNLENKVLISSFNHYSLKNFAELAPTVDLGLLYESNLYQPEKYANSLDFSVKSLNPAFTTLNSENVKEIQVNGYQVFPYTLNKKEDFIKMKEYGVDGIITDYPDQLKNILNN
ncbi:glycerophosphodiester phosphodiesterase [Halanaerobium praevalens]|uniref:Glycerophosphoryl diester phosphodiesterase n=1 Tax=Halanaerobium praevalens (strain ATCC 33744 / DSM 2228 / GSL) TaxID=572479 RepID=E3DLL3_HALPG|nr:glycerophosphodiester phosphodiesterase [Halanaerobium praevalens]ADO76193.1 glycerophosphoryl diester phosphodiesterase [Halanaerobium praevalens DSM 2228]